MPRSQKDTGMTSVSREIVFWLFLFLVITFLRIPSFSDSFYDPDVAATAYSAQLFAEGSCIYPDAVETKPPGSYVIFALLFAISRNMVWVHVFMVFYHLAVSYLLYRILSGHTSKLAGYLAALLYGAYSASSFVNGYAPNFETWAVFPLAVAFLYISKSGSNKTWMILIAGIFCGLATLMKQQALIVAAFFWLGILVIHASQRSGQLLKYTASFLIGGLFPWIVVLIYFSAKGCAGDLFEALNPSRNLGYITSNQPGEILLRAADKFWMFARHEWLLLASAGFGLYALLRKYGFRAGTILLLSFLLGSFVAVWAGTKFYGHYFVFLISPLALFGGIGMGEAGRNLKKSSLVLLALIVCILMGVNLRREVAFSWMAAGNAITTGHIHSRSMFQTNGNLGPDWHVYSVGINNVEWSLTARKAGHYLRDHTTNSDTIWVYDYIPSVYWFSDRIAPTRHYMNFEIAYKLSPESGSWHGKLTRKLKQNRQELIQDLTKAKPKFIVRARYGADALDDPHGPIRNIYNDPIISPLWRTPLFPELKTFISEHYLLDKNAPEVPLEIWKLKEPSGLPPAEPANPHGQIPSN